MSALIASETMAIIVLVAFENGICQRFRDVADELECPRLCKVRMSQAHQPHADQRPSMRLVGVASVVGRGW